MPSVVLIFSDCMGCMMYGPNYYKGKTKKKLSFVIALPNAETTLADFPQETCVVTDPASSDFRFLNAVFSPRLIEVDKNGTITRIARTPLSGKEAIAWIDS